MAESGNSFEATAREFFKTQSSGWSPKYAAAWIARMEKDLFPYLGKLPLVSINAPVLLTVLRRVEKRGAIETAHSVRQTAGQVFPYGIQTGRCERSPAADLHGALKPVRVNFVADSLFDGRKLRMLTVVASARTSMSRKDPQLAAHVAVVHRRGHPFYHCRPTQALAACRLRAHRPRKVVMAARSIASLTLSFGLVSIPVKLYSATESSGAVKFNLLAKDGSRLKQQYVSEKDQAVVPRSEMVKGYEFEKDRFVLFSPEELKALEESSSPSIEIMSFIPEKSVDALFYDKAYLLAPDKRGGKPYALLAEAMRQSGRCALAKWAWKAKQYVVQIRPGPDGLVLQQLLYAAEVRSHKELDIERVEVSQGELQLALQLIDQISTDSYDPSQYVDEEKKRILAAIDGKIAGKQVVVASAHEETPGTGQVIDLMEALRASLARKPAAAKVAAIGTQPGAAPKERKGAKRGIAIATKSVAAPAPAKARARK